MSKANKIWHIALLVLSILMLILSVVEAITFTFNEPIISLKEDSVSWMFQDSDDVISWLSMGFMFQGFFWTVISFFNLAKVCKAFERK